MRRRIILTSPSASEKGIITYYAPNKLEETTSDKNKGGLHTNQFNTEIVSHTFENGVGRIEFANTLTTIGTYAFYGEATITEIVLPNTVVEIDGDSGDIENGVYGAFCGCSGLTSINIPNGVRNINVGVFSGCTSLPTYNSVRYTDSTCVAAVGVSNRTYSSYSLSNKTKLLGGTFIYCSNLTNVAIPNNVISIGGNTFDGCKSLTSVTIGNSVTSIGESAFFGCSGLTSVTIPNSVTSIGDYAFAWCSGLTSITVEATTPPTLQGPNAFNGTNNCPIYVPSGSVAAYKAANNWSNLSDRIQAIT